MTKKDESVTIYIESGVSLFTKKGFCSIRINGKLVGQMSPDEVRELALNWLGAAEAAESDAAVFALLTERVGVDENLAGQFISELRDHR